MQTATLFDRQYNHLQEIALLLIDNGYTGMLLSSDTDSRDTVMIRLLRGDSNAGHMAARLAVENGYQVEEVKQCWFYRGVELMNPEWEIIFKAPESDYCDCTMRCDSCGKVVPRTTQREGERC